MIARGTRFGVLWILLGLCGCAGVWNPPQSATPLEAREELGGPMVPGNDVEVVNNGEVFDVLERDIAQAKSSIHIIVFIWRPSEPSDRLTQAIVERARRGVECRIIVDPFWSPGFDTQIKPVLEKAGCQVHIYKPLPDADSAQDLVQRQHRKVVVIDGEVALTGGFGIWKSWMGNGIGHDEWRDVAVRFRGPVVAQAQKVFEEDWSELTGHRLPSASFPPLEPVGNARALFIGSRAQGREPSNAQRMLDWLLGSANDRIWIANSYFVPSNRLSLLLQKRQQEGVDVRILAPGDTHDMPIVKVAQRSSYRPLEQEGVRIWEYQAAMMHSKVMIVDRQISWVGSVNLDPMSLRQARECAIIVDDEAFTQKLAEDFLVDLHYSKPIVDPQLKPYWGMARWVLWFLGTL
jgi:cardiolipin synthase